MLLRPSSANQCFIEVQRYPHREVSKTLYNYFRTYDPDIGRYTQSDPIGLGGGLNRYMYAHDDPIDLTDPDGLKSRSQTRRDWNRTRGRRQPGQTGAVVTGTLLVGSTQIVFGGNGTAWYQTTAIGLGATIDFCIEPPRQSMSCGGTETVDEDPWPGIDGVYLGVRAIGVSYDESGTACLSMGPGLSLPGGVVWDVTPEK